MTSESASEKTLAVSDAARLQRNGKCLVLRIPINPDYQRMQRLLDVMIETVSTSAPRAVVLDFSETRLLDSNIAERIEMSARQAGVLGVPVVLCELRPALCSALVRLGQQFPAIHKSGSIDQALGTVRPGGRLRRA